MLCLRKGLQKIDTHRYSSVHFHLNRAREISSLKVTQHNSAVLPLHQYQPGSMRSQAQHVQHTHLDQPTCFYWSPQSLDLPRMWASSFTLPAEGRGKLEAGEKPVSTTPSLTELQSRKAGGAQLGTSSMGKSSTASQPVIDNLKHYSNLGCALACPP